MKTRNLITILSLLFIFVLGCQAVTRPFSRSTEQPTAMPLPTATSIPTLEPITERSLAGLLVQSPVLGMAPGPYMGDYPIKGLGIVNRQGQLVKFTDAGVFKGYSPAASYIVYQYYSTDSDANDKLRAFDASTGQTAVFERELHGEKNILGWLNASPSKFIVENSLISYLFEAYGYFEGDEILMADASTGEMTLLLEHTFQADLSPDSSKLAYTTGEQNQTPKEHMQQDAGCFHAQLFDIATSTSSPFDTSQLTEQPLCLGYPKWSPDGKWIAWIGYFADDTFRAVVFEASTGKGTVYDALNLFAGNQSAWGWNIQRLGWVDNVTFWTDEFQVDVSTGIVSPPQADAIPYDYVSSSSFTRPDSLLTASIENNDGIITLVDSQGNLLSTFPLNQLYTGERTEYGFDSGEFLVTSLVGWLPFAPTGENP